MMNSEIIGNENEILIEIKELEAEIAAEVHFGFLD